MASFTDIMTATKAVMDPATSGADLAQIAQAQPSLWPQVAGHPNAYPELLAWLDTNGDATTKQVVAARRTAEPQMPVTASPPPPPPVPTAIPSTPSAVPSHTRVEESASNEGADNGSFGWAVLGFFVPIVGLVLWIVWHSTRPRDSKMSRNGFIASIALGILITAAVTIWTLAAVHDLVGQGNQPVATGTALAPETTQPTPSQITPPDSNSTDLSQMAWITVPSTNKKSTALQVDIHTDYQCPWCKLTEDTYGQGLEDLATSGDIVLNQHTRIFLDNNASFSGLGATSSERAAIAAACVDVADATKYDAYNNIIFQNQPATEGAGFADQQLTVDFPTAVGLSGDALQTFKNCYSGRQTQDWVENVEKNNLGVVKNNNQPFTYLYGSDSKIYTDPTSGQMYFDDSTKGDQTGVTGTPTIFVNSKPLSLNDLFTQSSANAMPTPSIGTDSASILALLQQIASS